MGKEGIMAATRRLAKSDIAVIVAALGLFAAGCAIKHLALELDEATVTGYGQAMTTSASATSTSASAGEQKIRATAGAECGTNTTTCVDR